MRARVWLSGREEGPRKRDWEEWEARVERAAKRQLEDSGSLGDGRMLGPQRLLRVARRHFRQAVIVTRRS